MESGESILDAIFDDDNFEDVQDFEMMDVEEGELVGQDLHTELGQINAGDNNAVSEESATKNQRCTNKRKKKKNRRKKASSGSKVTDIDRFVSDICRCLKEKKTYMVYAAVGCLGVSALADLVREVDVIQGCGGQKTADGRRFRSGGGILWNVLKTRDPNAYREIMMRGKQFEKQFRLQNIRQGPAPNKVATSERTGHAFTDQAAASSSDGSQIVPNAQLQLEPSNVEGKRKPVHDRLRVPVTYDDLPGKEDAKDEST